LRKGQRRSFREEIERKGGKRRIETSENEIGEKEKR